MMVDHWLKASNSVAAVELEGGLILTFLAVAWAMHRGPCRKLWRAPVDRHGSVCSDCPVCAVIVRIDSSVANDIGQNS